MPTKKSTIISGIICPISLDRIVKMNQKKNMERSKEAQIRRITYYEQLLYEASAVLKAFEPALEAYQKIQPKIAELDRYYGSPEWRQDFEASEEGNLPKDLPCGVLSEDGIDHLLEDNRELLSRLNSLE